VRIAFVNSAWPPSWGGGEKWTVEAAEWFREREDEVCVVGRPQSKLVAAARGRNLPVHEHRFGGDFDPLAILRARKLIKNIVPDLVVVNFNKEAWQFGLAVKRLKIPVVARHGFPLLRNSLHHHQLVEKVLTRLVVNARSIRDHYEKLGFNVVNMPVIHNGVKVLPQRKGELRKRFAIMDSVPLMVAAGRIESQKRFDRVIDITQALLPSHPNLKVLIAGEGQLRAELEQDVSRRGLTGCICFTGFIPDLPEIIGDADLFLLTSDDEGTPNVLLEAMAARVACIAFSVGAVPEIFAGELSQNSIPPGDTNAMTQRADELLKNRLLREQTAEQMHARAKNEFAFENSMQQFAELFDQLVHRKS
jgi:glycosyltransferase involved in cell wall biosynthesis